MVEHRPAKSPFLVPFKGGIDLHDAPTAPPKGAPDKDGCEERLEELQEELDDRQRLLYAHDRHALLLVFQAMDAAGKDSTIRAVMRGVDPAGCQVWSFKQPNSEELDHDFLWRVAQCLPERGRIGIWNRSHYEEVGAVRVHPEYLQSQKLPRDVIGEKPTKKDLERLWKERFESIRSWEEHLARNGTVIVKFWLHVSREEQKKRFLARIDEPQKNWKFSHKDVEERQHWDEYMEAYSAALSETSRPCAPWYAIPADSKPYLRMAVAEVVCDTLEALDLSYPTPTKELKARLGEIKKELEAEED